MRFNAFHFMSVRLAIIVLASMAFGVSGTLKASEKPRVIVTSDDEIDDECSMVRLLLYASKTKSKLYDKTLPHLCCWFGQR